jgi:hypothetical protein
MLEEIVDRWDGQRAVGSCNYDGVCHDQLECLDGDKCLLDDDEMADKVKRESRGIFYTVIVRKSYFQQASLKLGNFQQSRGRQYLPGIQTTQDVRFNKPRIMSHFEIIRTL